MGTAPPTLTRQGRKDSTMMYAARHRRSALRRTWSSMNSPLSWVDMAGAALLTGMMTALFTIMVLHG